MPTHIITVNGVNKTPVTRSERLTEKHDKELVHLSRMLQANKYDKYNIEKVSKTEETVNRIARILKRQYQNNLGTTQNSFLTNPNSRIPLVG